MRMSCVKSIAIRLFAVQRYEERSKPQSETAGNEAKKLTLRQRLYNKKKKKPPEDCSDG